MMKDDELRAIATKIPLAVLVLINKGTITRVLSFILMHAFTLGKIMH